jgi:hypothetical protein
LEELLIEFLLIGALALLVLSALVAPLESLGWWAGWYGDEFTLRDELNRVRAAPTRSSSAQHFVVFLSGVGSARAEAAPLEEQPFLATLRQQLPDSIVIDDIFAYSVLGVGLDDERRLFDRFWRWLMAHPGLIYQLINVRNLWQVLVAADRRYGAVIGAGIAGRIAIALLKHGYHFGSGVPVTLIGSSGGAQMGLSAAPFLANALQAPLRMVSLGGIMSGDPAVLRFAHLDHLYGTKDPVVAIMPLIYPGRWPFNRLSPWHRATNEGIYHERAIGPFTHTGAGGYFDSHSFMPDGNDHSAHSALMVCEQIASWEA